MNGYLSMMITEEMGGMGKEMFLNLLPSIF
jgi:hypothetical protein